MRETDRQYRYKWLNTQYCYYQDTDNTDNAAWIKQYYLKTFSVRQHRAINKDMAYRLAQLNLLLFKIRGRK